jgi:hypothetical protein
VSQAPNQVKLLKCGNCGDIFSLNFTVKTCSCGKVSGAYTDELNAWYSGETAMPLGIDNGSFQRAQLFHEIWGQNPEFKAFFIPVDCRTFVRRLTDE